MRFENVSPNLYQKAALRKSMRFNSVRARFCVWDLPRGPLGGTFGYPTVSLRSLSGSTWCLSACNAHVVFSSARQRFPRRPLWHPRDDENGHGTTLGIPKDLIGRFSPPSEVFPQFLRTRLARPARPTSIACPFPQRLGGVRVSAKQRIQLACSGDAEAQKFEGIICNHILSTTSVIRKHAYLIIRSWSS